MGAWALQHLSSIQLRRSRSTAQPSLQAPTNGLQADEPVVNLKHRLRLEEHPELDVDVGGFLHLLAQHADLSSPVFLQVFGDCFLVAFGASRSAGGRRGSGSSADYTPEKKKKYKKPIKTVIYTTARNQ
eukprot:GHVT01031616.1.p1 GENE.GHVT01031616.1~~GHVT01031616.1.p1  ORF type:complete len:129 (+),score=23.35 GHVT01031616.1:990-1376(+)